MSHDQERKAVEHRVQRLQTRVRALFGDDGGELLRMALETELVGALAEGTMNGLRRGYKAAVETGRRPSPPPLPAQARKTPLAHPPPQSLRDDDVTPVRPVDWIGPRGKR